MCRAAVSATLGPSHEVNAVRRPLFVILLLALSALAVACRGGESSGTAIGGLAPAEVLGSASDRMAEESSFRFEFEATFEDPDSKGRGGSLLDALLGGAFSMTGEGAFDLANNRTYMKMNIIFMEVELIQDGDTCYTRSDWFGDLWEREPCEVDEHTSNSDFFFGDNPTSIIDALRDHSDEIEDLGEETINGVKTRHLRAMLSDPEIIDGSGMDAVPVDIWVDEQGRPAMVRIAMEVEDDEGFMSDSGTMIINMEFRFFDWGASVDIPIPSEDEIGDGSFFGIGDDWDDDWAWDDDEDWEWPWDDEDAE
jgi:hypothetical protein